MIDRDEETISRAVKALFAKRPSDSSRSNCPDEETLAVYLDGALKAESVASLETHLSQCSLCVEDLVAARNASIVTTDGNVPERLINRAMALVKPSGPEYGAFDIVVRLFQESLEAIKTSAEWLVPMAPVPAAVRGESAKSPAKALQFEKAIGKFRAHIEVEQVDQGRCHMSVTIKNQTGQLADGLRLSLASGGREQASYLTRQGLAVFDGIAQGEYELVISDSGTPVATVRVKLE